MRVVDACYEGGLLKPSRPLALRPGERVGLIVVWRPDPNRWDLDRLAKTASEDELELAQQGLTDWAQALDQENHR